MTRAQVQFERHQYEALKRLASRRGVSVAQLVREGVDRLLADDRIGDPWADLFEVVGKYGRTAEREDAGREHDRHLDEAFGDWRASS